MKTLPQDSPVEQRRKELPRGNGSWAGWESVYDRLAAAAERLSRTLHLSEEHENLMAALGCGHEETMKAELHRCYSRGLI